MLSAFVFFIAFGLLLPRLIAACVRRAMPLAAGAVTLWFCLEQGAGFPIALLSSLCVISVVAFALDWLAERERSRVASITLEAAAGVALAMFSVWLVLHTSTTEAWLMAALALSALAALGVIAQFRGL